MKVYVDYDEDGNDIIDLENGREKRLENDEKKTKRKMRIWTDVYGESLYMPIKGYFKKGKIHCSCMCCAFHEYTMSDRKEAERMMSDIKEAEENDCYADEIATTNGTIKKRLKKIKNNNLRCKKSGGTYQKRSMGVDYPEWEYLKRKYIDYEPCPDLA